MHRSTLRGSGLGLCNLWPIGTECSEKLTCHQATPRCCSPTQQAVTTETRNFNSTWCSKCRPPACNTKMPHPTVGAPARQQLATALATQLLTLHPWYVTIQDLAGQHTNHNTTSRSRYIQLLSSAVRQPEGISVEATPPFVYLSNRPDGLKLMASSPHSLAKHGMLSSPFLHKE